MSRNLVVKKIQRIMLKMHKWKNSTDYWERRYKMGCDSGSGSYNRLAMFKADIINNFVKQNNISSVIEWGCGDGNQLMLAQYRKYVGIDVSSKAIEICRTLFQEDDSKCFYCNNQGELAAEVLWGGYELALSLDVIYHLVEDDVFEKYMKNLFSSSNKYVCIYSCNFNKSHAQHVRCRKFTDYIEKNESEWKLVKKIPNRFPYDSKNSENTSWSDFYFYEKQ